MKLRFTPRALAELEGVLAYIAEMSPQGAARVQKRIRAIAELLCERPLIGQPIGKAAMRRVVVNPYPYLIFYRLREDEVVIVGIRHGAQDTASMPSC